MAIFWYKINDNNYIMKCYFILSHLHKPNFCRTMYNAYTGPRAFLPHSAINLSVKTPAEVGSSTAVQSSLDLSVPEGGSPYLLNPTGGGQVPTGYNSVPNANNVSSPQILDLTRTTNMIR